MIVAAVDPGQDIPDEPVAIVLSQRPLRPKFVRDRQVDTRRRVATMEVTDTYVDRTAELLLGKLRVEVNRATRRIAAVECALRATQDFDAVEPGERAQQQTGRAHLPYTVHVDADSGNPAHVDARGFRGGTTTTVDQYVGNRGRDVLEVLEVLLPEPLVGQGRDRQGDVLDVRRPPSCSDHDLLQRSRLCSCIADHGARSPNEPHRQR